MLLRLRNAEYSRHRQIVSHTVYDLFQGLTPQLKPHILQCSTSQPQCALAPVQKSLEMGMLPINPTVHLTTEVIINQHGASLKSPLLASHLLIVLATGINIKEVSTTY